MNFSDFVRRNWLVLVLGLALAIVIVLLVSMLLRSHSNDSAVVSAPAPVTLVQPSGAAAQAPPSTIVFCFRLDGQESRHLPALMGNGGSAVYPNGISGYNWALLPNSTGQEPYGLLADSTFFAKEAFLKQWGMNSYVELKAEMLGWAPTRMNLATVAGEPAYVFKR